MSAIWLKKTVLALLFQIKVESESSVTAGWNGDRWSTIFQDSVLSEADTSTYNDVPQQRQDSAQFTEFKVSV